MTTIASKLAGADFAADLVAETRTGKVGGAFLPGRGMRVFKGIPYAAPPVGSLRWCPPRPPAPWQGIRSALEFGPDCPQTGDVGSRAPSMSEDCLYLNIWSPTGAQPASLPVMVWIHGGSFVSGSGSEKRLDGARLAQQGPVVVVTINYRVGLFGFFSHPALSSESSNRTSGNYGLLDQICALRWVRDNIAQFGGDPGRVTAFGVSAGSAGISLLLTSPLAAGLFQQAILESPGAARRLASLADAEIAGMTLGYDLGALRALTAQEILDKTSLLAPKVRGLTASRVLRPIRDGHVIAEDERPAFKNGRLHKMPIIVGSNRDEGSQFTATWPFATLAQYQSLVAANFTGHEERALAVYPAATDDDVAPRVGEMFADTQFNYGIRLLAQSMSAQGKPTWRYLFTRRRPGQNDGPHHVQEVPYVFGNLSDVRAEDVGAQDNTDELISTSMMKAWLAFAATGSPNGPGLAAWPAYDAESDCYLEFGDDVQVRGGWRTPQLDFLDAYYAGDDRA